MVKLKVACREFGIPLSGLCVALELPFNESVRAAVPSIKAGLPQAVDFRLPERDFHVLQATSPDTKAPAMQFPLRAKAAAVEQPFSRRITVARGFRIR